MEPRRATIGLFWCSQISLAPLGTLKVISVSGVRIRRVLRATNRPSLARSRERATSGPGGPPRVYQSQMSSTTTMVSAAIDAITLPVSILAHIDGTLSRIVVGMRPCSVLIWPYHASQNEMPTPTVAAASSKRRTRWLNIPTI